MGELEGSDKERRRYPRVKSLCLISYVLKDGKVQKSAISMGRTLNISPVGVKLEIYQPVEIGMLMEMEIGIGENIHSVRGEVVHSRKAEGDKYILGIEFIDLEEDLAQSLA